MLSFTEYKKAVILPVIKNDGHHFIGGVYCNKKYINEAHLYTHAPYIDPILKVDKKVIFGGILFNHYGHFLLESLSRIWYIKEHQDLPICWTFLSGHVPLMSKWQKEIFDILNIKNEIFFLEKPTQFSSVIVPFPGYIHGKNFISHCYTNAIGVYENQKKTIDKLYISRTKISPNCGGFDNEQELENLLKKRDWEIFHPQEYSVKEQLFKISSAKIIFGIESSAFHTLVLMKNISTKFFTFSKAENTIGTYNIIAKIKNIDYTTLNISKKIKKRFLYTPLNRYDVDILQIKELLEQSKDFFYCNNIENYKIKNSYKIISYREAKDIIEKSSLPTCEEEGYYRSVLYRNDNRLDESKNVIQKFVNNENVSCSLLSHYCRILIDLGDIDDILKITNKILKRQIHWVQTFPITLSSFCFKKGYYDLAEQLIFLTLKEYPNSFLANHKLSLIYGKKKQFNKALEYARKAFKLNEKDINLATHLSNFLRWTKRYEEATSFIKKMIVEKPTWTEAYRQLSYMQRDFGNLEEAISLAKKAIELSPDKLNYNDYLCVLLCKKKDFRAALEVAQKVLVHDSNQAWVYNQLANIYYEIGDLEKALVNIQKAIEIDTNNKSYKSFYQKIKYKKILI